MRAWDLTRPIGEIMAELETVNLSFQLVFALWYRSPMRKCSNGKKIKIYFLLDSLILLRCCFLPFFPVRWHLHLASNFRLKIKSGSSNFVSLAIFDLYFFISNEINRISLFCYFQTFSQISFNVFVTFGWSNSALWDLSFKHDTVISLLHYHCNTFNYSGRSC